MRSLLPGRFVVAAQEVYLPYNQSVVFFHLGFVFLVQTSYRQFLLQALRQGNKVLSFGKIKFLLLFRSLIRNIDLSVEGTFVRK